MKCLGQGEYNRVYFDESQNRYGLLKGREMGPEDVTLGVGEGFALSPEVGV